MRDAEDFPVARFQKKAIRRNMIVSHGEPHFHLRMKSLKYPPNEKVFLRGFGFTSEWQQSCLFFSWRLLNQRCAAARLMSVLRPHLMMQMRPAATSR
jgi:hypothetical protein